MKGTSEKSWCIPVKWKAQSQASRHEREDTLVSYVNTAVAKCDSTVCS